MCSNASHWVSVFIGRPGGRPEAPSQVVVFGPKLPSQIAEAETEIPGCFGVSRNSVKTSEVFSGGAGIFKD